MRLLLLISTGVKDQIYYFAAKILNTKAYDVEEEK
jgi:hypothetical protein